MPRLWIGNFDFEHQLVDPGRTLSQRLRQLNAELAPCWLAVADDGDAIWTPEPIPAAFWDAMAAAGFARITPVTDWRTVGNQYELTPWGWTAALLQIARKRSSTRELPAADVVRTANSRRWSFGWENQLGIGCPHQSCCDSVDAVANVIRALPDDAAWVIKAEFGMSGRERIRGRGPLRPSMIDWLRKRLRADGVVFFEPWLDRIAEAGILFEVPLAGDPTLIGIAEMLPSTTGQYAGSVFVGQPTEVDWTPAVCIARQAAAELQRLGYFGPLGVDAMCYRTADGEQRLRPLQDVNARWTMGRLALGWRRFFPDADLGIWSHGGAATDPCEIVISTSPERIGETPPHHRTALIVQPRG